MAQNWKLNNLINEDFKNLHIKASVICFSIRKKGLIEIEYLALRERHLFFVSPPMTVMHMKFKQTLMIKHKNKKLTVDRELSMLLLLCQQSCLIGDV